MASNTQIANMALSLVGVGKRIANLDTEDSPQASACNLFFEIARDSTLRDFAWPFASKTAALGLVEEDPNEEWGYSYGYPSDCVDLKRIQSGVRNDTRQSRIPFRLGQDGGIKLIYTDQKDAVMEYTMRADDPSIYPPDFTIAFSCMLASLIAPTVSGGDPFKLGEKAMERYNLEISKAKASASDEEQPEEQPESEFIRAREE